MDLPRQVRTAGHPFRQARFRRSECESVSRGEADSDAGATGEMVGITETTVSTGGALSETGDSGQCPGIIGEVVVA